MKTLPTLGLVAAAVLVTVAIEESRIAALRGKINAASASSPASAVSPVNGEVAGPADPAANPVRTKSMDRRDAPSAKPEADDEGLGKTVRKMWDNPAGKAMMNQGVKMAVAMMYEDFIEGLDLTKEEEDHFKTLLGKGMADQQEIGMKMMSASPEERAALAKEIETRKKENEEAIKTFLNSDEDYQTFTDYQNRLPERQQLDGLRAALAAKDAPLAPDTESRLVEALYQARTNAKTPDFSGPDAFGAMAEGDLVKNFEQSWDIQEQAVMKEAGGILDETQMSAFRKYREQLKEMQLMGMKMAEKMMSGESKGE